MLSPETKADVRRCELCWPPQTTEQCQKDSRSTSECNSTQTGHSPINCCKAQMKKGHHELELCEETLLLGLPGCVNVIEEAGPVPCTWKVLLAFRLTKCCFRSLFEEA